MPTANDVRWFKQTFGAEIEAALQGTPFELDMITAIACQETGYIWSILRKKSLPADRILALCVGDTIDYGGPGKGRQAFPKTKAALIAEHNGHAMFAVARQALEDMSRYVPGYGKAVQNPAKFCHGYGVFQRDLQFFKVDPDYFLERRYERFDETLAHCLAELRRGLGKLGFESKASLTDAEFAMVAIAYNTGGYNKAKGLKQGHFSDGKHYGEWIVHFLQLAHAVEAEAVAVVSGGPHVVIARDGLKLRGGPGTGYGSAKTLPTGTEVIVVAASDEDPDWVLVDLEGDGLLDGYMFAPYLAPVTQYIAAGEDVPEPA